MKPRSPFTQPFEALPDTLPLLTHDNALLPGGELPLELIEPTELSMFLNALRSDQLIGMVQPRYQQPDKIYAIGCAGRLRQYRERKDGRLNVMLTGVCRYRILEELPHINGYRFARVDWRDYRCDYEDAEVDNQLINSFKSALRHYFDRHQMQVDWKTLDKLDMEELTSNLILVMNMNTENRQRLLEAPTVTERLLEFQSLLEQKTSPVITAGPDSNFLN